MAIDYDGESYDWFCLLLEEWGKAARGLCGPQGLTQSDSREGHAEYTDRTRRIELALSLLIRGYHRRPADPIGGKLRYKAIRLFYLDGFSSISAARYMHMDRRDFDLYLDESTRAAHDLWKKI